MQTKVILIRGLSTTSYDILGVGPLAKALRAQGVENFVLTDLGRGSFAELVEKAVHNLSKFDFVRHHAPLHLIGHSMGGLLARALVYESTLNVAGVTTIATPHRGSVLAEVATNAKTLLPRLYKAGKIIGYNFDKKAAFFGPLTRESMSEWNKNFPDQFDVDYASFEFSLPANKMSPPVRAVFGQIPQNLRPKNSDGYVELESQTWGQPLGHFALDHLAQIGWNLHAWWPDRQEFHSEYQKFILALRKRIMISFKES